jgi:hypothetical protein
MGAALKGRKKSNQPPMNADARRYNQDQTEEHRLQDLAFPSA